MNGSRTREYALWLEQQLRLAKLWNMANGVQATETTKKRMKAWIAQKRK